MPMRLSRLRLRQEVPTRLGTITAIILTILLYGLVLLLLAPVLGPRARLVGSPFIWYWAWRSGVRGGVLTAISIGSYLPHLFFLISGVVSEPIPIQITVSFTIINVSMGVVVGRMSTLGRRLRGELDRRIRAEVLLRESEECYRLLFDSNPRPMWVSDLQTMRFLAFNAASLEHYGYSADELDLMGMSSFLPPGDVPRPDLPGSRRHRKKDGTIIDVELDVHLITFRGREARLVLATDVTEQKKFQAALEHEAHHDALTGLPNRAAFRSSLEQALARSGRSNETFALFLMDLDRFKAINDTLGHAYGDQTLRQIGPRLQDVLREGDVLARLGGDEFGVFLPGADGESALRVADRLLEAFRDPFILDGRAFDVGTSIGIAIHPDHGHNIEDLLHRADVAMYASKRSKQGPVLYDHMLDEPASPAGVTEDNRRLTLEMLTHEMS